MRSYDEYVPILFPTDEALVSLRVAMENHSTQSPAETEEVRPSLDARVAAVVTELVERSRLSQRELVERSGLSKDQLSRSLRGARQIELNEALAILSAAGLPGRREVCALRHERRQRLERSPVRAVAR